MEIQDEIWIKAPPARVFAALTDGGELGKWWPERAESEPYEGGKLVLHWFGGGGTCATRFRVFQPEREVAYKFYTEDLAFRLEAANGGTNLTIVHDCGEDAGIHVAQSWGFLKANLKVYIERGIDLREAE